MDKAYQFLKDWALIIAMVVGVASYFIYVGIPVLDSTHEMARKAVAVVQPFLIFCMLFLTFCKVDPRHLRLCRWHLWMLLMQGGAFTAIALILIFLPHSGLRIVLEGAMLLLICPTATAAPVITRKLGGNVAHITTYTVLINLVAAILIPLLVPYVHPTPGMTSLRASTLILGEVFPLLLMPLVLAFLLRKLAPRAADYITRWPDAPFYIWVVSLALAMTVTTRCIVHSQVSLSTEIWLVAVSLACCLVQFGIGWRLGIKYHDRVTAGQAFGQKNTVLAIWMGYTFFSPITAVAGGFYSIWHNVINSYQLMHAKRVINITEKQNAK